MLNCMESDPAIEYLIEKQGVLRDLVDALHQQGFRFTHTMLFPDYFEQVAYERSLGTTYSPRNIQDVPLSGGGKAYWVREKKK